RTWKVIAAVEAVAKTLGVSMAQVALAWLADRPAVTSVILGARTREQLADNLAAAGLKLDAEHTQQLTDASAPEVADYPYGKGGVNQRHRKIEGGR
ncbi:MAG: aldo/keto reductase, partial [Devosia sp.]|nr:aldo/keto reductase [Devosia sp.]